MSVVQSILSEAKYGKKLRIIKYSKQHNKGLVKLYALSYRRKKPLQYFQYRLNQNPFGKPIAYVMKYGNELVGFYAITPIYLTINEKKFLGGYSFLTMTHPNFSGRGIFTKLASKTFKVAKKRNYNFILGFANHQSYPTFLNKLGFKELKPINYFQITRLSKKVTLSLKIKSTIPKNIDSIWNMYSSKKNFSVRLDRSYNYIKWRFLEHPLNKYTISYSKNAFFVFKKYGDELHIIEFFGKEDERFYLELLSTAKSLAKKLVCKRITIWIPVKHRLKNFTKIQTCKLKANSFFIIKVFNPRINSSISNMNNWYYTMSDADIF